MPLPVNHRIGVRNVSRATQKSVRGIAAICLRTIEKASLLKRKKIIWRKGTIISSSTVLPTNTPNAIKKGMETIIPTANTIPPATERMESIKPNGNKNKRGSRACCPLFSFLHKAIPIVEVGYPALPAIGQMDSKPCTN